MQSYFAEGFRGAPGEPPALPQFCAAALVCWHIEFGMAAASERMPPDVFRQYLGALDRFVVADQRLPQVQAVIARTQLSGVFASFQHESLPAELWRKVTAGRQGLRRPETLGEAARWIVEGPPPVPPQEQRPPQE